MNIIQATSTNYFRSKFGGALFFGPDGSPCVIPHADMGGINGYTFTDEHKVRAYSLSGTAEKPAKKELIIEPDFFDSMERFDVPELGWRTAAEGRIMMHITRATRSYKKGVCLDALQVEVAPHSSELMDTGNISRDYYNRPTTRALMILSPNYKSMEEGLAAMNDGSIMGFAVSNKLAVLPSAGEHYNIAYGLRIIGRIEPNGSVVMHTKLAVEELS